VLLKVTNKPHKQSISMATTVCNVYVTIANAHSTKPLHSYPLIIAQLPQIEISSASAVERDNSANVADPRLDGIAVAIDVGDDNGLEGGAMIAVEAQVEEASE
jgi:hypothetical protein